jgi:uncharacterized protein
MNYDIYFPRGIANGNAFCNREKERKKLINNIKSRQHVLIMSPRRYGKTSLVKYAVNETKAIIGEADLFVAVDAKHIEHQIITAVKNIISQINTPVEQALEILRQFFIKISAKWTVGTQGINIALIPEKDHDPAIVIKEALQALDNLLEKKNIYAVFFLDEMQEIGEVAEGKGIEGAIRHVAQQTKKISFVFSGSNRHLLAKMFYDKARPLYKLCDRMILDRIDKQAYQAHIGKYIQQKWNADLTNEAFETLINLTERHPFYVNCLCRRLFETNTQNPPNDSEIKSYWDSIVNEEKQELAREISVLSAGQRKILVAIASGENKGLTGKKFLHKVNMTGSSVSQAIKILEEGDYLEKQEDGTVRFIDPLLASALRIYYSDED